jgi:hypothetical protein
MHLIYAPTYAGARTFALHQDLMPGDWQWIHDPATVRANPRADVFKTPKWEAHPHRNEIDAALDHARGQHRLGTLYDLSGPPVW